MNIYWSVYNSQHVENLVPFVCYPKPEKLLNWLGGYKNLNDAFVNFSVCPAVQKYMSNTYLLKFPFDYNLNFDYINKTVNSNLYDQNFFNRYIMIRDFNLGLYSIKLHYIFIAEESLDINYTGVNFSYNDFTKKTSLIPGKFNIGKWIRPLDCAFIMNNQYSNLQIEKQKEYASINFLTEEKIKLVKFYFTDKCEEIVRENASVKKYRVEKKCSLEESYDIYEKSNIHKYLIDEIKKNIIE